MAIIIICILMAVMPLPLFVYYHANPNADRGNAIQPFMIVMISSSMCLVIGAVKGFNAESSMERGLFSVFGLLMLAYIIWGSFIINNRSKPKVNREDAA